MRGLAKASLDKKWLERRTRVLALSHGHNHMHARKNENTNKTRRSETRQTSCAKHNVETTFNQYKNLHVVLFRITPHKSVPESVHRDNVHPIQKSTRGCTIQNHATHKIVPKRDHNGKLPNRSNPKHTNHNKYTHRFQGVETRHKKRQIINLQKHTNTDKQLPLASLKQTTKPASDCHSRAATAPLTHSRYSPVG